MWVQVAQAGYVGGKFAYKHRKGIRKGAKVVRSKTTGRFLHKKRTVKKRRSNK